MAWPIVPVLVGGLAVTDASVSGLGTPVEIAENNIGTAVTFAERGIPVVPAGRSFFISAAGDDNNPGTQALPWKTIAKVNNRFQVPGDVFKFNGGDTFAGGLVAGAGNVKFTSYGAGQATISSGNAAAGVAAANWPSVKVDNLNLVGGGNLTSGTSGVSIVNSQAGNTKLAAPSVTRNTISGYGRHGVQIEGTAGTCGFDGAVVTDNIIHDCTGNFVGGEGSAGIYIFSATGYGLGRTSPAFSGNLYVVGNLVYNINGTAGDVNWVGSGIFAGCFTTATVALNVIHDCGSNSTATPGPGGILVGENSGSFLLQFNEIYNINTGVDPDPGIEGDGNGIVMDGGSLAGIAQYNYIHDCGGSGIYLGAFVYNGHDYTNDNCIVRFNICQNNCKRLDLSYGELHIYSGPASHVNSVAIHNNTCYAGRSGQCYTHSSSGAVTGRVANNLFYGVSGKKIVNVGIPSSIQLSGNNYWAPIAGVSAPVFSWNGTDHATYAAWQTATNQEKISGSNVGLQTDPLIYVPGGGFTNGGYVPAKLMAYNLQFSSTMANAGLNLSQFGIDPGSQDYYGNAVANGSLPVGAAKADFSAFATTSTESAAFLARVGSFTKADNVNYDSLISGLVSDGNWSHLDFLHVLAAPNSAASLLNLKSTSYSLLVNGTTTFTARQGYVSNGTTGFLNTQYQPSTAGGVMTAASGSLGVYMLTGAADAKCAIGATNNTTTELDIFLFTVTNPHPGGYTGLNDFTGVTSAGGGPWANTKGMTIGLRNAGTDYIFHNGAQYGFFTTAPTALVPRPVYLQAMNTAGTATDFNTDKIALDFLGDGSLDQLAFTLRAQSFVTAYAVNQY